MDQGLAERIKRVLEEHRIVLFMKGSKLIPQCGFSAQVVGILRKRGVAFEAVNVLSEPGMREGVKEYSNWPTFPQLFVDGQLIGGCDIVTQLHENGQLDAVLAPPKAS